MHWTPGHTPGSSSWSWQSCEQDECATVLYADSLGTVSAPGFRFSDLVQAFNGRSTAEMMTGSIDFLRSFDCDVLVFPLPFYFQMQDKRAALNVTESNPFLSPDDCAAAADRFEAALKKRLVEEQ
jgi:metallo-beta-lactamase class B